jgi:hypothetical protein
LRSTLGPQRSTSHGKDFLAPFGGNLPERLALQSLFKIVVIHLISS